jgi:exodeoxyribonuclease-1
MFRSYFHKVLSRSPKSLVFYDIETSGLDPCFDQILQVAAMRTDWTLADSRSPSEHIHMRARRHPWVVPTPEALLTTGVSPQELERGPSGHRVMFLLHEQLGAWAPALHLAYNGARFDELFLSQSFYRAALPPYLTQMNGSTRADVMRIAQALNALDPANVRAGIHEGRLSFRLGAVCDANDVGIDHENAHDALADVLATVALTRRLAEASPFFFAAALSRADKEAVRKALHAPVALRLRTVRGEPDVVAFCSVCSAPSNANAKLCVDLEFDPDDVLREEEDALATRLQAKDKRFLTVRSNAHEMIFSADEPVIADRLMAILVLNQSVEHPYLPLEALHRRALRIRGDAAFALRLSRAAERVRAAWPAPASPDEALYSRGPLARSDNA